MNFAQSRARCGPVALIAAATLLGTGCGRSSKPAAVAAAGAGGASSGASGTPGAGGASVQAGIRWVGRVDTSKPAAVKLAWSGSGLVATVHGSKISVQLQTEAASAAFFQPVIDKTVGVRFQVASGGPQTVVLADGLADTDHAIELYRDTEGMYGDSVFLGFADGVVVGAPPAGRLIEIIGDSISAGYGNLGVEVHPSWGNSCTFSLDTQSAYSAYGSVLARELNAEVSIIARSGWGMYRDAGGNTSNVLSSIYENTLGAEPIPHYDFARQPDAVLINLGTNDSIKDDPGARYEQAYVAFLHTVRSHYANAWVFLTIGPMTSDPLLSVMRTHLDNVVASMADPKIMNVPIATQDVSTTGCGRHPNVAEDRMMADALKTVFHTKLGW